MSDGTRTVDRQTVVTRFLTPEEKVRELLDFHRARDEGTHFRPAESKGGEGYIDPEVLPLVDALNSIAGVCTMQSCCGHKAQTEHGEWVHPGQLWLRLDEATSIQFDTDVGLLLALPTTRHVQKLYAYETMKEPHEVIDVQFHGAEDGRLDEAAAALVEFFSGLRGSL